MIAMMEKLQHRGKDSAGVAIYGGENVQGNEYIVKVLTKDIVGALSKVSTALAKAGADIIVVDGNRGVQGQLQT